MKLKIKKIAGKKILVAMSGGVDSSVAAALLKKQGYFAVGVFMKFWSEPICKKGIQDTGYKIQDTNRCCSGDAYESAKSVCAKLDIPFYALDVQKKFKKAVVDYFIAEYAAGRTPNPCVRCNEEIKFKLLLETARKWGMDYVATGHYARLRREFPISNFQFPNKSKITNFKLLVAKDKEKDQSYFLYNLTQEQLRRILFPIGDYKKPEVRKMAKKWGLPAAGRPESFEVCFVPDRKTADFLKRHIKMKPGKIVDEKGRIIGRHEGLPLYTIGQRHGIDIKNGAGPYYVAGKNPAKNELIVTDDPRSPLLLRKELVAGKVNWISGRAPELPGAVSAKIRYRHKAERAWISKTTESGRYLVRFAEPQRAVTAGQSVVFYGGGKVLGGGVID